MSIDDVALVGEVGIDNGYKDYDEGNYYDCPEPQRGNET